MMQRAVQLDPNNRLYHTLLNQYRNRSRGPQYTTYTYTTGRRNKKSSGMGLISKIFLGYMALQFFFMLLRIFLGFGFYF